jgi:iron complex transport system substrate-binding protein
LPLPFEQVYARAADAQYWINAADFGSRQALANADERYTNFKAWQSAQVYSPIARQGAAGGNAYLELGYFRPDIVLADLIKIFHPNVLPTHKLYFYRKLK